MVEFMIIFFKSFLLDLKPNILCRRTGALRVKPGETIFFLSEVIDINLLFFLVLFLFLLLFLSIVLHSSEY